MAFDPHGGIAKAYDGHKSVDPVMREIHDRRIGPSGNVNAKRCNILPIVQLMRHDSGGTKLRSEPFVPVIGYNLMFGI